MRFPMTLGGLAKVTTFGSMLVLLVLLPLQYFMVLPHIPVPGVRWMGLGLISLVALTLLFTVAIAPRAVRVTGSKVAIERLFWPDYEVPLREVVGVEAGPPISIFGKVRRVAGNGGLMGFTGLFHVGDVGLVRLWATRLGVPTVLVRRAHGRPVLLGVDDPTGLERALRRAAHVG